MQELSQRLSLVESGIVYRRGEQTFVYRPGRHGGPGTETEIAPSLADEYHLSTGDMLGSQELSYQGRIDGFATVNGLPLEEALSRPLPRPRRNALERSTPERWIPLTTTAIAADMTSRLLDAVAPFGVGCAGIVYGPHGSGLTSTLRTVVHGIPVNAADLRLIVLLIGARGEEITDWRRRYPAAEVVVCPVQEMGATPEETLLAAELVLECAQRQTELGRHIALAVDSLTELWGAMLQTEEADAQREADVSQARRGVREWFQRAGYFGGEGLLGSGLGGSLTLVGTVWHDEIDIEAEEEGESHPHLRLLEHVLNETTWRVPLSGRLAAQRLYPAIDTARCYSEYERALLSSDSYERRLGARRALSTLSPLERHAKWMEAFESALDNEAALEYLAPAIDPPPSEDDSGDFWAGWSTDSTSKEAS